MRTVVVSDLHLGGRSGRDLLRDARLRSRLVPALEGADRVVLLGDVVELRGLPADEAIDHAQPALEALGEAADGAELVVVPGNHDHRFAAELIDARRRRQGAHGRGERPALGLEQTAKPGRSGPTARLARALGGRITIAYPGLQLRSDVYATHGHQLDRHNRVPALETLAAAGVARAVGGPAADPREPDAYEAALAPLYAFIHELSQWSRPSAPARGSLSLRIWQTVNPPSGRLTAGRVLVGSLAIPAAVRLLDLAGLGSYDADLSPGALRRAALEAMAEAADRLGVEARHVVFGHTHRRGPLARDDPSEGWRAPDDRRLWNSGGWVYEPALIGTAGRTSGHWPGTVVIVEDNGDPRLESLLEDVAEPELARAASA